MEPWDLRTRQLQPGYDHWECLYSACDECFNAPIPKTDRAILSTQKIKRRLAWVAILIAGAALLWWLNRATTPPACRVPIEHMSLFCQEFLFPH